MGLAYLQTQMNYSDALVGRFLWELCCPCSSQEQESGQQSTAMAVHSSVRCWPGDGVQAVLSPVMLYFRQCCGAQAHQGFSFVFPSPCRHVQQPRDARTPAADFRKPSADAEYDLCPLHAEHDANSCPEPGLCSTGKSVAVVCCCRAGHEPRVRSVCCWGQTGSSCRHWSRVNTQFGCISR